MKQMMTILGIAVMVGCVATLNAWAGESSEPAIETTAVTEILPAESKPVVQIAILLDTSGSMSGLIDQARTELWSIVNEFIFARKHGKAPEVQVALYEYGNSGLTRKGGYIRRIVPLTTDLDKISEELFALTTNGGDEHCGWVIREAAEDLAWSDATDDLKVIFIAGNEPFTQGPVHYKDACAKAIERGVVVNTIHCGPDRQGIEGKWKDGAVLADGRYLNIDHNRQVVHIAAPQDTEIAELGVRLNQTYIPFGLEGELARGRQTTQDLNAQRAGAVAQVQRAVTKSSANYKNAAWDLIDAVRDEQVDLEQIEPESLPDNMRKMNAKQRQEYIKGQAKQREEIQTRIQQLNEQRRLHVAKEMKRQGEGQTLGSAIKEAIRTQARKKHYTFESPQQPATPTEKEPQK